MATTRVVIQERADGHRLVVRCDAGGTAAVVAILPDGGFAEFVLSEDERGHLHRSLVPGPMVEREEIALPSGHG